MKNNSNRPFVSVVIPVYNEEKYIGNTLNSIFLQNYPTSSFEILIADGNSDDSTKEIISKLIVKHQNIHLIHNQDRIIPIGLNRSIQNAKGDIIIRMDGHCEIESDYISKCVESLGTDKIDCVGGVIKTVSNGNLISKSIAIAQSSLFGIGNATFRTSTTQAKEIDTVAWGAYKRGRFEKIGGFDEELLYSEDDEFNFRLIQNGGKIWLDPSIKSVYYPRNSLKKLFKQYFQYGLYKVRVMQKRRGFASWRHLVPGTFVLALLISIFTFSISHLLFYLILGSYLIANITATMIELMKPTNSQTHKLSNSSTLQLIYLYTLLSRTFFTLHLSYGLGFLIGLIKFWNKWNDREIKDHHFDREQFIKKHKNITR